jgi:hypothetical protein
MASYMSEEEMIQLALKLSIEDQRKQYTGDANFLIPARFTKGDDIIQVNTMPKMPNDCSH